MDKTCQAIIIGSVLGDGHIRRIVTSGGSTNMEFKYSDKYYDYLLWLHSKLKPLGVGKISAHQNNQHVFHLKHSVELGVLRYIFYPKGKKIIPQNIKELLTDPLSIAVWYMDDGTLDFRELYHHNVMIATYSFTFEECKLLVEALEENFGIQSSVTKCRMRGKVYPRLYIWSRSTTKFLNLVDPYLVPCMYYKTTRVGDDL